MLGSMDKTEFNPDKNYDEFYSKHQFSPWPEDLVFSAHKVLPRAEWVRDYLLDLREVDPDREIAVLDLGCLDGFIALTLLDAGATYARGVDLSVDGVNLATERAKSHNVAARFFPMSIEEYLQNAADTGQKFDIITIFEVVEHLIDPGKVWRLIDEVLAPDGKVFVTTPDAEGGFGIGNHDECHIRIYSHRLDTGDLHDPNKPVVSLPMEIAEHTKERAMEINVWNGLCHLSYQ